MTASDFLILYIFYGININKFLFLTIWLLLCCQNTKNNENWNKIRLIFPKIKAKGNQVRKRGRIIDYLVTKHLWGHLCVNTINNNYSWTYHVHPWSLGSCISGEKGKSFPWDSMNWEIKWGLVGHADWLWCGNKMHKMKISGQNIYLMLMG